MKDAAQHPRSLNRRLGRTAALLVALATTGSLASGTAMAAPTAPGWFPPGSWNAPAPHDPMAAVAAMQPSWNLGNTLDAVPDETCGGNKDRLLVLPTQGCTPSQPLMDDLNGEIASLHDHNLVATVHYYGYYPFSANIAGGTTFDATDQKMQADTFALMHSEFVAKGIPVYLGEYGLLYRAAVESGRQVRILHVRQLHDPRGDREGVAPEVAARRRPVLVVPGLYLAEDSTLDWLEAYARAGGHLVLGPRTGYADQEARARHELTPARLTAAAGAHHEELSNVSAPLPLRTAPGSPLTLPQGATATHWVEGLTSTGATVLAAYDHPHFGRWAAATTHAHGAGRVTCVGTVPSHGFATALAGWLAPTPVSGWRDLPASVTATTGTSPDGRRVHVVHNWNWEPAEVRVPVDLTDVLAGGAVAAGTQVQLGSWDVRVFTSG
nr:beta-galactosidase trimerization domain-containing protein [Kitasatospora mediocidica]